MNLGLSNSRSLFSLDQTTLPVSNEAEGILGRYVVWAPNLLSDSEVRSMLRSRQPVSKSQTPAQRGRKEALEKASFKVSYTVSRW